MSTFLEGVEAVRQACTLVLLLPALALVLLAGKRAPLATTGFVLGATTLAWAQAAQHWEVEGRGLAVFLGAIVLVTSGVLLYRSEYSLPGFEGAAGLFAGGVVGWLWQPCAGPQLAIILNDAPDATLRTFVMMLVYVTGACLVAIVLAALPVALPQLAKIRDAKRTRFVGLCVTLLFAGLMAIGQYDELVGELVRMSST